MPIRSTGCATCRKRKIRCDETRPACKRCATHGVPCGGYRQDQDTGIQFQDQTDLTVRRVREEYKTKQNSVARRTSASPATSDEDGSPFSTDSTTLPDQLWVIMNSESPRLLYSPGAARTGLYNTFMDIYLPKNLAELDHFSFYKTIASNPTEHAALLDSMDTLSLLTVGHNRKDQSLLKESRQSYGKALKSLMWALAEPGALHDDQVLAAITVLQTCGFYSTISEEGSSWMQHVSGGQQLIEARGAKSLQTDFGLTLFSNARHGALISALIARKGTFMAEPEWREVAFRTPIVDQSTHFYDTAIQLPGLLERYDGLAANDQRSIADIDALLADCNDLELDLRNWMAESVALAKAAGEYAYQLLPIECFTTFSSLCADRTFEVAFMFPHFGAAYVSSVYWMCIYFLRTDIQRLHKMRHALDRAWYPKAPQAVEEAELHMWIVYMCQCMPFFCEPVSSNSGQVGMFLPLRTAVKYFTHHARWREAQWVRNVLDTVFVRGMIPPTIRDDPYVSASKDRFRPI